MARQIVWSKMADRKFDLIIEYLLENWGESTAQSFVRESHDFIELLSHYPNLGTIENKERSIRGFVLTKQITLFYKVTNTRIVLLNFYDNRQNPLKPKF